MKEISKADISLLIRKGVIKNTKRGYISLIAEDPSGLPAHVGFYRTVNGRHRYMEDYYVTRANLIRKGIITDDKSN